MQPVTAHHKIKSREPDLRSRAVSVYLQHGIVGLLVVVVVTLAKAHEIPAILAALGPGAPILIAMLVVFASALAQLNFPLTEQLSVTPDMTAFIIMFPLLGPVMSAWIAVTAPIARRMLAMAGIGLSKLDMRDPPLDWARTFSIFGTFGIPVTVATVGYQAAGGVIPTMEPSLFGAARIALFGIILILVNEAIVVRVSRAWGYSFSQAVRLGLLDSSVYILTIPYAILTAFAYGALGWGGVLAAAFTGVLAIAVVRKLALTTKAARLEVERIASLTNVGEAISLDVSREELLATIYRECAKVVDVTNFAITLVDEPTRELVFELKMLRGERVSITRRRPLGSGLTGWVVANRTSLRLGRSSEQSLRGLTPLQDGFASESWLGVPMVARDRVIGAITVQTTERNAYSSDDGRLLAAIANQAAAAIENAHLYKDMESRVNERTNELREANIGLVAADRSKSQFLASMSHELRTPLNAIIGFSAILLDTTRGTLPPRLYKFLENIRAAGGHLLDLINDILDLAKIEAGKMELRFETFDIRETVSAVERVIKGVAAERHVSVITKIDDGVSQVCLDEGRLKQILLNVLSNAVKFSNDAGFVYLTVKALGPSQSPLERDSIRIDVTDTGAGIPSKELDQIFSEFYQVDRVGKPHRGGTGLGLSLTKSFVHLLQGTICATSELGKGATFTIYLPREAQIANAFLESHSEI